MVTHRRKKPKKKGKQGRTTAPYPFELRLKVVKLYLEDGYPATLIAEQFGISDHSVYHWSKRYRQHSEQGLLNKVRQPTGSKLPTAVTQSIVKLKKENPEYGIRPSRASLNGPDPTRCGRAIF